MESHISPIISRSGLYLNCMASALETPVARPHARKSLYASQTRAVSILCKSGLNRNQYLPSARPFSCKASARSIGVASGLQILNFTRPDDAFTFDLALTYMDGRPVPFTACLDSLDQRDMLVDRVIRYYGAYLMAVPPESAKGKAVVCGCGVTPVFEDDEL